jgi:hypothetical protein
LAIRVALGFNRLHGKVRERNWAFHLIAIACGSSSFKPYFIRKRIIAIL